METVLTGIPGIEIYLDDVIISGATTAEHRTRLDTVLTRITQAGLRLKICKCRFAAEEVQYLGYTITVARIYATNKKLKAINEMPKPTSRAMLQSFLV